MYEFDTEKYNWDMQFIQVNIIEVDKIKLLESI